MLSFARYDRKAEMLRLRLSMTEKVGRTRSVLFEQNDRLAEILRAAPSHEVCSSSRMTVATMRPQDDRQNQSVILNEVKDLA
jgi:hypothetical protein